MRKGANTSGREIIKATTQAGRPSSTIITRFSVPISSTAAIPTVTWNSDRRSSRPSGSSAVAASANGSIPTPTLRQDHLRMGAGLAHRRTSSIPWEM